MQLFNKYFLLLIKKKGVSTKFKKSSGLILETLKLSFFKD